MQSSIVYKQVLYDSLFTHVRSEKWLHTEKFHLAKDEPRKYTRGMVTAPTYHRNLLLAQNAVDEDNSSMNKTVAPHSTDHTQPLHRLVHIVHLVRKGL